ncbi:MAG: energy-coupling factor transporter transmembrane component T [Paraburkholderia sp.]|uniref:energy-coupling factor transporter transmembrane component T family protein n=1 Tax=Paraburkholderia sp. TaxID=1926495 RepID=UPI003C69676C
MSDPVDTASYRGWLASINPVFKFAAVLPPLVALLMTRDMPTPTLVGGAAIILLLSGVPLRLSTVLLSAIVMILVGVWTTFTFALLTRADLVAHTPVAIGGWLPVRIGALQIGATTATRLIAIVLLALLGSLGTTIDHLASALTRQCRIPYRFAYGAIAAARFIPRYRQDLITLRLAQQARGIIDLPGPVGYLRRTSRAIIPLLAGGARYAERLSLSMDARGFGAHRFRNERHPAVIRARDLAFLVSVWASIAIIFAVTSRTEMLKIGSGGSELFIGWKVM